MEEVLVQTLVATLVTAGFSQYISKVVLEFLRDRFERDPEQIRRTAGLAVVSIGGILLLAGAAVAFYYYAEDIVAAALAGLTRAGSRGPFLLAGIGVLAGGLLFLLRKYARVAYGALEIILAIIGLAGYPPTAQGGSIPWLISLLALIYILVRGLDNVDVGIKEWKDRAAAAV